MKPSSKFNPCFTPVDEVANMLNGLIAVKDCKLDEYLRKGEISQASQLALTVLKTANETPDCGKGLSIEVKTSVSKIMELIKVFTF